MDGSHFDALSRSLTDVRSRRGLTRLLGGMALGGPLALLGLVEVEAKCKKKCGPCKRCKKGKCRRKPAGAGCAGKVCGDDGCGGSCGQCGPCRECIAGSCATQPNSTPCGNGRSCLGGICLCPTACCADGDCPSGKGCFAGTCVTVQGSCPPGGDACTGTPGFCGEPSCLCFTNMEGQTRCAGDTLSGGNTCTSDAQCAALFPNIPGAFCKQDTGAGCSINGQCMAPCPT